MQSSSELYQILKDHTNSDGLPIIQEGHFQVLNAEYGKEVFRDTLATFIATERPPFPLKNISVYDIKGALVQEIFSGSKPVGFYQFNWDASAYSSGIYLINISSNNLYKSHKIMLIK